MQRSWLDLGNKARVAFALVFFGVEIGLLVTAPLRDDRVFGFQMFNGSSDITIRLRRELRTLHGATTEVPLPGGVWTARDAHGDLHRFFWGELVRGTRLVRIDHRMHAKDGLQAQVFHLQRALDYAVEHIPDDGQTSALIADVHGVINGRERVRLRLRSKPR